jgi:hypothetical protein
MRSSAAAIAWEFRRRHRWGLIAVGVYLSALVVIRVAILGPGLVNYHDAAEFAFAVIVPLTSAFLYCLAVFTFGLSGDFAARQSMYPARMFTLPVTSSALALWPMVYGSAVVAVIWLATRKLAAWPSGVDIPTWWPALLGASLLAWTQALTWMPYPLPGLRVVVTVLWLTSIDAMVMAAIEFRPSEGLMILLLAPHVPIAFLVARRAVARARRGEVPDWRGAFTRLADLAPRSRRPFSSASRAQFWFEWRRHGRSLPALVAILLPFELAMLFGFRETPAIVFETLGMIAWTPPFMAAFVGARESHAVTPFSATRPLTSAALVAAKLKVMIASTLAAWAIVIVAVPVGVRTSGTGPMVIDWMHEVVAVLGRPRALAFALLIFAALLALTWKQLVQSLYIGLSGRPWAVKASVFVTISLVGVIVPLVHWVFTNEAPFAALWRAFPWIAGVLVCVKLVAAAWVIGRLHDTRLLGERAILAGAVAWDAIVFGILGTLAWLLPGLLVPRSLIASIAILAVPLVRLSAAPLALAWSRHR